MLLLERRDEILLPAPSILEAQGDVLLVREREALDAGLLVRGQVPREVAKALEHALQLGAPALRVVGNEKFAGELLVVRGKLALDACDLIGRERRKHRRRLLRGFRSEPAVARSHIGEPPGHVLRSDALRRALARAAH